MFSSTPCPTPGFIPPNFKSPSLVRNPSKAVSLPIRGQVSSSTPLLPTEVSLLHPLPRQVPSQVCLLPTCPTPTTNVVSTSPPSVLGPCPAPNPARLPSHAGLLSPTSGAASSQGSPFCGQTSVPAEVQSPLGPIPATSREPVPTSGAPPAIPDRNNSGPWPPRGRGWGRTARAARGPLPVLRADALRKAIIVTRRHLGVSTERPPTRRREGAGPSTHDVILLAPGPRASRAPPRATGPAPPREALAFLLPSLLPRACLCLEPLPPL